MSLPSLSKIRSVCTVILLILTAYNKFKTFCWLTYFEMQVLEGISPLKSTGHRHCIFRSFRLSRDQKGCPIGICPFVLFSCRIWFFEWSQFQTHIFYFLLSKWKKGHWQHEPSCQKFYVIFCHMFYRPLFLKTHSRYITHNAENNRLIRINS